MIHLNPNSATEQTVYLTLQEMKKDFNTFANYLVHFQSMASREDYYFIGDVATDNARYTALSIFTNVDDPLNGDILLEESGQYFYKVYGQNSATNLDPTDAAVVALIEEGTLDVAGAVGYNIPTIDVPDNVIYYQ
tara:strand:- start:861 stop:1265 length:405 start_codon:yes stop_codon:yes gene_type:complete